MAQDILEQIFKNFNATTKAAWEQQALQDLKGSSLNELNWEFIKGLNMDAYANNDDLKGVNHAILKTRNPDWQVGQHYLVSNYKQSNQELLADLMHGLNAPVLTFVNDAKVSDLEQLFEGVGLQHITTHLHAPSQTLITNMQAYLKKHGCQNTPIYFRSEKPIDRAKKSILIDARAFNGDGLGDIRESLERVKNMILTYPAEQTYAHQMSFIFEVNNNYLLSIAKLRAFNLLWINLMKSLALERSLPFVYVEMNADAFGKDEHDNLINASAMAMSAVLGGADHIIVRPSSETDSAKRLARNIQLILKHESGFNQVADPIQGSYYIESLTKKIVNLCW